jgi:hypothetical protein
MQSARINTLSTLHLRSKNSFGGARDMYALIASTSNYALFTSTHNGKSATFQRVDSGNSVLMA